MEFKLRYTEINVFYGFVFINVLQKVELSFFTDFI